MSFKTFATFCRKLPHITEDVKWESNLVFSVGGKMFAMFELPDFSHVSFRTTPWLFSTLISKEGIDPAPYLARYNWVLVTKPRALPPAMLRQLMRESYHLVAASLPVRVRRELGIKGTIAAKQKLVRNAARLMN